MKENSTGKNRKFEGKTDWERLKQKSDAELRAAVLADDDILQTDTNFWKGAKLVLPENKETITIRLDRDVLNWFKEEGRGYQTRINAVLASYMKAKTFAGNTAN